MGHDMAGDPMGRGARSYHYAAGKRLGDWVLVQPKGLGGNGEVWIAKRSGSTQRCALKILRARSSRSEPYRRFQREVAAVLELQERRTPHNIERPIAILPIIDSHLPSSLRDDLAWFAMPLAVPIREALVGASAFEIAAAVRDISWTLVELARHEVHHRDIKPENLYRYERRFVVGDFGLVKRLGRADVRLTRRVPGPFAYLPIEAFQGSGDPDWEKIDVYCLAKTLWVLMVGETRPPVGRIEKQGTDSLTSRLEQAPQRLPGLDVIDDLIDQATDERPERRPTLGRFAFILDFSLANAKAPDCRRTLTHYTHERVMNWLLTRWQSDDLRHHQPIQLSEQLQPAFPGLSNRELRATLLTLSDFPAAEERVQYVIGEFGEDWADVRPVWWEVDEMIGSTRMEARVRPVLLAIAHERPAQITVELSADASRIGSLSVSPVEARRLLDYAGDRGWLRFEAREAAPTFVTFRTPVVQESGLRIVRRGSDVADS